MNFKYELHLFDVESEFRIPYQVWHYDTKEFAMGEFISVVNEPEVKYAELMEIDEGHFSSTLKLYRESRHREIANICINLEAI